MSSPIDRLSRRGVLKITAEDCSYEVTFKAHGPWLGGCTTDKHDLYQHCYLGAKNWHGEGADLVALVAECEEATRPRHRDVDELVYAIEARRDSRTHGPPLPTYQRWNGWRPGVERWLRTSSHAQEYVGGYLRDLEIEREFIVERKTMEARAKVRERASVRSVLNA